MQEDDPHDIEEIIQRHSLTKLRRTGYAKRTEENYSKRLGNAHDRRRENDRDDAAGVTRSGKCVACPP